jgi:hypothetical protein
MKNPTSFKAMIRNKPKVSKHWQETARRWQHLGPPLRPAAQDIGFFSDFVQEWEQHHRPPRVLLLGVTPEIYRLPWPEKTSFLATDKSQAMIDAVWPGPKKAAQCVNWLSLKLPDSSRDIVLCDGGLHLLAYPREQQQLVRILQAILSNQGLCIFRLYVPPSQQESPEAVLRDLIEGRIPNLNVLKLRLGMSLMKSAAVGVALGMIWQVLHEVAPDLEKLARRIGWSVEHIMPINTFRGSAERFYFVTVNQVTELFCINPGGFEVHGIRVPSSYELSEQCPTIVLRRCRRSLSVEE